MLFIQDLEEKACTKIVTTAVTTDETTKDTKGSCEDAPDCEENGIVDEISCDFTPWAYDRCPATCDVCTPNLRSDDDEEEEGEVQNKFSA